MKRVALYFRVSTADQTNEPQRIELLDHCRRRGWELVREYADKVSGSKFTRVGLDALMADVRKGRVDIVACVKLDRLGRSLAHLAQLAAELEKNNVALVCTSQGIDTSESNPAGRLQMAVLMAVAQFEREIIVERTMAGLAAARARGSRLGRPRFVMTSKRDKVLREWRAMNGNRPTLAVLANQLGCSIGKAHALAKEGE